MMMSSETLKVDFVTQEDVVDVVRLLCLLNPDLSPELAEERWLQAMQESYQCVGAFVEGKLVGICGVWTLTRTYMGRSFDLEHYIVDEAFRGRDIGGAIMNFIKAYGLTQGIDKMELACYTFNEKGLAFYQRHGFNWKRYSLMYNYD
ncbi:MAG: GNAT family N-acetyltransferase [Vampirovibrionales bacterium]|jgi:GNAT superfamily N-acetyltransferase